VLPSGRSSGSDGLAAPFPRVWFRQRFQPSCLAASGSPLASSAMEPSVCATCGKSFYPCRSVIHRGKGWFCSRQCSATSRRQGEIRACPVCGKEFYARPKQIRRGWARFCSLECHYQDKRLRHEYQCAYCGKEVLRAPYKTAKSTSGLIYCNRSCRISWTNQRRRGANHPNWKGGESTYRDTMLREGPPPVCRRCGLTDIRVLTVHHLDEDRTNNQLKNLVWLCHNCHHLVHHFEDEREKLTASSA
jgi:hypothetical protein